MRIEFLREWRIYHVGAVADLGGGIADILVRNGTAKRVIESTRAKVIRAPERNKRVNSPKVVKHGS